MSGRDLPCKAKLFAAYAHRNQVRKYTGAPYFDHLSEVASLVAPLVGPHAQAAAWLHDTIEDCEVTATLINAMFGDAVAHMVVELTNAPLSAGNRKARKKIDRDRLHASFAAVQNIKVADLISNTASIAEHDPKFAPVYLKEAAELLDALKRADDNLLRAAWSVLEKAERRLARPSPVDVVEVGKTDQPTGEVP